MAEALWTAEEIAAATGGTPKAVESRLYRARAILRKRLGRER